MAKTIVRDVLHATFFMPRGDSDIPQAFAGRIDLLHHWQMLGLQSDEALCGEEHPVCKEYPKPGGCAALRFLSKGGNDGKTIVNMNGTGSALFVNALGMTQFFSSPALSATDFVFIIISAGMLRRWKLPGFHKASVNNDPRQAPYYANHDQSPYFNQLVAAMYDFVAAMYDSATSSSAVFPRWA